MSRGLSSAILAQLAKTTISGVFYGLRITRSTGNLYWAERDGIVIGGQTYEGKILDLSSLDFTPFNSSTPLTVTVENIGQSVKALNLEESFAGCKVEVLEFIPDAADYSVKWVGYFDSITELTATRATLTAYTDAPSSRIQIPRGSVGLTCRWGFGRTDTWVSERNCDGSECPYQRTSSVGFTATLVGAINATVTSIVVSLGSLNVANGMEFIVSDRVKIDGEQMNVTAVTPVDLSFQQTLTVVRGINSTAATHADSSAVLYANCQHSSTSCRRRGMYGNNPSDTYAYSLTNNIKHNYFGGFPFIVAYEYGRFLTKSGSRPQYHLVEFGGQASSYSHVLPLPYGRCRVTDAALILAKPEGAYLTTIWAIADGLLATNTLDDVQTDASRTTNDGTGGQLPGGLRPLDAYSRDAKDPNLGPSGTADFVMQVNGARRHDPTHDSNGVPFGIQAYNGEQDQPEPGAPVVAGGTNTFFPTVADFNSDHFSLSNTAWLVIRVSTQNNPSVDLKSGQVDGEFQLRFGRVVRVYSDAVTYTRKATTNPAWVALDLITSRRSGLGYDWSRINIQSFLDWAARCDETITSTVPTGSPATYATVPRYTFNGVIDSKKSYQDWINLVCMAGGATSPFLDADGKVTVKALGPLGGDLSSVPVFSSKDGVARQIIWAPGPSGSLESTFKFRTKKIEELPNQIAVNYIAQDPAALNNPNFVTQDKSLLDPKLIDTVVPDFVKTQIVIDDEDAQRQVGDAVGDGSIRINRKEYSLPGVTTLDEAARVGTLILRAGEYANGGLANNGQAEFQTYYDPDAEDLSPGDVIACEDDTLDAVTQRYFRVISYTDNPVHLTNADGTSGGILYVRTIQICLHDDAMFDDTAFTVTKSGEGITYVPYDKSVPPVTSFLVVENGVYDHNNKPTTQLTFSYVPPDPTQNFKDVVVMRSSDDGSGNAVGDWRFVTILTTSPQTIDYPISGNVEHFIALSRSLNGTVPDPTTLDATGTTTYYPQYAILVDGITNTLPAPASPLIQVTDLNGVSLQWQPYTGDDLRLFKTFHVYRNTVNNFLTASLVATVDGTLFIDATVGASTTYYYWVVGFSILHAEGTPTSALSIISPATAGADTGVPDAPTVQNINALGSFNTNEYNWIIKIEKGAANQNTVFQTTIQISTDVTFATFPTGCLNETVDGPPGKLVNFKVGAPGVYYQRAKVTNAFGDSAWSAVVQRDTHAFDNLTPDTGIMDAPTVTLLTHTSKSSLAGNQFEADWQVTDTNSVSYYAYSVYVHDSSTLPTATAYYKSFSHAGVSATLTPGSNVVTFAGSPGFTTNELQNKELVMFATSRGASPTFDYEGLMFSLKVTSNTATTATLDLDPTQFIWNLSGLGFYIVVPGAGNHFWEKVKYCTPLEINQGVTALNQSRGSFVRSLVFNSAIATAYVWVAQYNLFGQGKVTASPPSATFPGLTPDEIGFAAVTPAKLTPSSQDWTSNLAFSATDYRTVAWTSGTITLANGTSYSIAAGNTGSMAAFTYVYLDPTISLTVLQVATSYVPTANTILVCTAQNTADTTQHAQFIPYVGTPGFNNTVIGPNSVATGNVQPGAIIASKLTKNAQGFNTSCVFTASDYRTIAWTSGTIQTADGTTYSISSGNTGSMSAVTFVYFDPTVSTTVLQHTTSYSTAVGDNVILLCIGQNTADTTQNAFCIPAVGVLGINGTNIGPNSISTGSIQAGAITTATLAASAVTAAKISVASLDAIAVNAGTITAGTFIGTVFKTSSSGARIELDATNGLSTYDASNNLYIRIPLNEARIKCNTIRPASGTTSGDQVHLANGDLSTQAFVGSGLFQVTTGGGNIFAFSDAGSGITVNSVQVVDLSGNLIGNGSNITSINGSHISSGTVADARLTSNVVLAAGTNSITGTMDFGTSGRLSIRSFASKAAFKAAVVAREPAFFADGGFLWVGTFDGASTYWAAQMQTV